MFAAPCVGNKAYNKEFQKLEKDGYLRHIRIANEGDPIPTNKITLPYRLAIRGNTKLYLFLRDSKPLEIKYRNTKSMGLQHQSIGKSLEHHTLTEYSERLRKPENQKFYKDSVEQVYQKYAGDFTA